MRITALAQVPEMPASNTEQQIENITENSEDVETEDDSYLQQLQHFLRDPVNLNTAGVAELKELVLLTPLQVSNLVAYRRLFGNFISIYEIQAIPGWNLELIQRLRPYITVSTERSAFLTLSQRLKGGTRSLLVRGVQVLEKSRAYQVDSNSASAAYPGSPQRLLVRYKYQSGNLLQYGFLGEKDAGEQFFKGAQKNGFDFYTAHLFARNLGLIKALALGDFTVNLGQGLTQWQSLAYKKGPDITSIKRQASTLRPYNSAGEINFHRGVGITLAKNRWEASFFGSYKNIDGNLVADSSQSQDEFVSSLQTSGYHRTKNEIADKGVQRQLAFGGNIHASFNKLQVGVNGIHYRFSLPLQRSNEPYNKYALSGNSFGNYSIDYSYGYKNLHFFGEAAVTNRLDKAFVNGLLISTAANVDLSFLYRNIQKSYQSLYSNAFTESTYPTNEKGLFAGISVRPTIQWKIDAYADFYQFPWLRFRVDAPSRGSDFFVQATYKPNKILEIYSRYRSESKSINYNPNELTLSPVLPKPRQNWRTQFSYKVNSAFTLRNRVELLWFDKRGGQPEQGFLTYVDVLFKPLLKPLSGSLRVQYFETDSYNSRLYAFENDVLFSYSIPVFYEKGYRYYININYDINSKLSTWVRWAQTVYRDKSLVGSGLDETIGNARTEVKLQALYRF